MTTKRKKNNTKFNRPPPRRHTQYYRDREVRSVNDVDVSDHVVLRYLERFCAVEVETVREAIRTALAPAVMAGATSYTAPNGMKFEIRGHVVTTVFELGVD